MKSSKLRIGNLLQDRDGKTATVSEITENEFKAYSGMLTKLPLNPIPLTPEWLVKFGFGLSNIHKGWHRITNGVEILFDIDMGCFIEMVGIEINYVHELQNLFFALTGEELEIKKTNVVLVYNAKCKKRFNDF